MFKHKVVRKYNIVGVKRVGTNIWYHGRAVDSEQFDLKHVGKQDANDQEGPGFYFTTSEGDAGGYAHPNGVVLTVELSAKNLVSLTSPPKEADVDFLINNAPDLEDTLTNWDEDPESAKMIATDAMMNYGSAKDVFESVWYDFYKYEPSQYLENMIKLGYDGHYASNKPGGIRHIIIYNPKVIKVLKKEHI